MRQGKWLWPAALAISLGLTACTGGGAGKTGPAAVTAAEEGNVGADQETGDAEGAENPGSAADPSTGEPASEETWGGQAGQYEISEVPDYLFPQSSTQQLDQNELYENFTIKELRFGRNEIYARHGMEFKSPELAEYFSGKSWYRKALEAGPFDQSALNDTELANIELLASVEEERVNSLGPHTEELVNPYLVDETKAVDVIQKTEEMEQQCESPAAFVKAESAGPAADCDLRDYLPSTGVYTESFRKLREDGTLEEGQTLLTRSSCRRDQDVSLTEQVWSDSQFSYYNKRDHTIRRIWWDEAAGILKGETLAQQGYGKIPEPTVYLGRPGTRILTDNARGVWGGQREYTVYPDYYTVKTSSGTYEKCLLMSYNSGSESAEYQFFAPGKGIICRWSSDSAWTGSVNEISTSGMRGGKSADLAAYREFMEKNHTTGRNSTLLADLTGDGRLELIVVSSIMRDENINPLSEDSQEAKRLRASDEELGRAAWQRICNTVTTLPQASPYPNMGYTGFQAQIEIRVYARDEASGVISCLYEAVAGYPHAGWNWLYLYEEAGRDYLLEYTPSMWQGFGAYDYKIFSLLESGQEQVLRAEQENYGSVGVEGEEKEQQRDRMDLFIKKMDQYRSKSIPLVEIGEDYFDSDNREYNYVVCCDELGMTP